MSNQLFNKSAVYHSGGGVYCYGVGENSLNIRLRTASDDVNQVNVYYKNIYDHTDVINCAKMDLLLKGELTDIYEQTVCLEEKRFKYFFELIKGDKHYYYCSEGFTDYPTEKEMFYFPYINADDIYSLPGWAEGKTIYQILIDRFYDGDSSNNPTGVKPWTALPDRQTLYGGDFDGIIDKMDYLCQLGVEIIYLSPLFRSPTYHKYDVSNYYEVEEIFGGKERLKKLINVAHDKGIRVILDCVLNHCSSENPLFIDVLNKGENSGYKDWFCIRSYPVDIEKANYDSFGGLVPTMPRFNTSNPQVIDYLVDFALYWTQELNIDGWRLDVADEVSHNLWKSFRSRLINQKADLLIIGEIWNQADYWLLGDQMHTVTNYKFRKYIFALARGEITSEQFWRKMDDNASLYKTPLYGYLVNLIGSHDTVRIVNELKSRQLALLVGIAMLTYKGMPLVYYGDELGMEGEDDPDNRRAFTWNDVDNDFAVQYRKVCKMRKESVALQRGDIEPIQCGKSVLAYIRQFQEEKILIAINFGEDALIIHNDKQYRVKSMDYLIEPIK